VWIALLAVGCALIARYVYRVAEDQKTLCFTASDHESGTPANFLDCLRKSLTHP